MNAPEAAFHLPSPHGIAFVLEGWQHPLHLLTLADLLQVLRIAQCLVLDGSRRAVRCRNSGQSSVKAGYDRGAPGVIFESCRYDGPLECLGPVGGGS